MKKKYIKEPVYESYFWLVWDCDVFELRDWVWKKHNWELSIKDNMEHLGKTIIIEGSNYVTFIIWINNKKNIPTLSHELMHKTFDTMKRVGIILDDSSEEAFAFLFSYYLQESIKALKK